MSDENLDRGAGSGAAAGHRLSRRHLLFGGAAAGIGAASAVGIDLATRPARAARRGAQITAPVAGAADGSETVAFYGPHQAGVETRPQAAVTLVALDLLPETDAGALRRMMRVLTHDAARLTQGQAALADSEPELAVTPARLTVTFGFGPGLVARAGGAAPAWLRPLPAFAIDQLDDAWNGGDLLLQIAADDPVTVAHATRMLLKDSRSFTTVRWRQTGFRRSAGVEKPGTTMRNLFGQVDGTVNLVAGTEDFDSLVWGGADNPAWLHGGTGFVLRRIRMNLDKWDGLDRAGREASVGRTLATGAPLTGSHETDEPDFTATTAIGFPVIAEFSHLRRARSENRGERILRRGYNYDDTPDASGVSNSGLLFVAFQADVDAQFVPIQRRLDELDLLNQWTTPIGSAVFAIAPGCGPDGYIGQTLF
ncbi:Dyp-type peroxidase [Cryobacterium frigoriphilum]|uniref:Dyp-type peroxidase n=1 Tax=Cryobacterium frigoriphilum TaxID=1259150 RepID=A0A4R8ZWE4_9MICO|nr:Dyp-type peroxidase [Cryobacterium frigoriphilum]TFD47790.1 Dyp-type peroxidase [Cryobacterium frigoriphilum]